MLKIQAQNDYLIIEPIEGDSSSATGLIIVTQLVTRTGRVLSSGDGDYEIGEMVLYDERSFDPVYITEDGATTKAHLVKSEDIIAKLIEEEIGS